MRRKLRTYSPEYRTRAIELCNKSDRSIAQVARDLGIHYATLFVWMKRAGKAGNSERVEAPEPISATATTVEMQAELERLRRELDEVTKERDFLKKAAAFFAQQSK